MSSTTVSAGVRHKTTGGGINDRIRTIGQEFETERPFLAPLPAEEFDSGLVLTPRVDRSSLVTAQDTAQHG
jgi:hypothetical protein